MKKIIFLLILFSTIESYSQDVMVPRKLRHNFNDTAVFDRNWERAHFIRGWNWGGRGRKLDDALLMNYYHEHYNPEWSKNAIQYTSENSYEPNFRLSANMIRITHSRQDIVPFNAESQYLSPVITVDTNDLTFVPRAYDTTGAIYGFQIKRKGRIINDHTNQDYAIYLLDKDSVSTTPEIVLENPWKNHILRYLNLNDTLVAHSERNGTLLYLTINLKQKEVIPDNLLDETIISIKLPYKTNLHNSGYIVFDSVSGASTPVDIMSSLNYYLGKERTLVPNTTNEFQITGRMIRSTNNQVDSSITLYAKFRCNSAKHKFLKPTNNDIFITEWIDSLKCEVKYYGKINCGIKFIRFDTPQSKAMYRGAFDSLMSFEVDSLIDIVRGGTNGAKLHRFYTSDEMLSCEFGAVKYFNSLIDTLAASEMFYVNEEPPEMTNYATGMKQFWNGANISYGSMNYAPYYQYTNRIDANWSRDPLTLNLDKGYAGTKYMGTTTGTYSNLQIKNSHYETDEELNVDPRFLAWPFPIQSKIENTLWNYKIVKKMLFNEKPWWANLWVTQGNWIFNPKINSFTGYYWMGRPKTGEEIRFNVMNPILLGAKGLLYWHKSTNNNVLGTDTTDIEIGFQHIDFDSLNISTLTGQDLIYSEIIGSDWIQNNDPNIKLREVRKSLLSVNLLGVDTNHIYIGAKSLRAEIFKIHQWIATNENTIMNLKLKAWYSKGLHNWTAQDPTLSQTDILGKYIDYSNIKTRPIDRTENGYPYYEQSITLDSGYYDLTLLSHNNNQSMKDYVFIGIQNRRTDPLINISADDITEYGLPAEFNEGFNFIPTAKFDSLVNFGVINGYNSVRAYFYTKWWSRLGAREITIPIKDPRGQFQLSNMPYVVRVTELKDNNWYSQSPYNDVVNDTIYLAKSPRNLTLKLLPGQGKLLKLTYYYPSMVNNSPANFSQYDLQVSSVLRYHTVYLKKDTSVSDKHSVWYRRSFPIDKTNPDAEVQWEPEKLVSKYYDFIDSDSNIVCTQGYNTLWCGPPQLVVRYDSTNSKDMVYVVWNGICKYASDSTKGYLFESIFPANDTLQTIPEVVTKLYDYYTDLYPTNNEFEIGTISINASKSGNYYAWSDARDGLCYGWKPPQNSYFARLGTMPLLNFTNSNFNCFLHPDLNRYSRIDEGEDETAIVFEGKTSKTLDSGSLQVFYTRLKKTLNGLQNYISIIPYPGSPASPITTDLTNKVIWQSANMPQTAIHHLPKIHRNIAKYEMPNTLDTGLTTLQLKMDRIYWSAEDLLNNNNGVILTDGYDLIDSLYRAIWYPKYYIGQMPSVILNSNGWVTDPTFAQGVMKDQIVNNDTLKTYYNDSAMVLSFTADGNRIFNLPHNFWTFMNPIGIDITSSPNLNEFINTGTEPTLPAIPMVKDDSLYTFMRTFYLDDSSNTMESRENFFKTQLFTKKYHTFFGIANNDKKARWFTPIVLTDEQGNIQRPKLYTHKEEENRLIPRDTIITDWFEVGTIKSIDYIEKGNLSEDYSMKIQRQSDGKIYNLQNVSINDNKYRIKTKMLLNGKNDKYRLLWTINRLNARYLEQIVIGDITQRAELDANIEQRGLGKLGDVKAEEFIDLNQETYQNKENKLGLSVYPNPANDELYVVCYLPQSELLKNQELKSDLQLKLFNYLGKEVYSKQIRAGQVIRIATDNLQSGNYFVKVFQQDLTTTPAEVRSVIIQR